MNDSANQGPTLNRPLPVTRDNFHKISANTYSGGTVLKAGILTVHSAQALGVGNVMVNGGTLNADPRQINGGGNYTQTAGGTLQLQVAAASPGQYDSLNVGGNATLGGTLQLISLGFQPKAGNQLTQFIDPFATGPGFNTVLLLYGRDSVILEFLNADCVWVTGFGDFVSVDSDANAKGYGFTFSPPAE